MKPHDFRKAIVSQIAVPPVGSKERKRLEAQVNARKGDAEFRRHVEQRWHAANALVRVQHRNGAGFVADQALREFVLEYNRRVLRYELDSLPGSWNVVEAFIRYLPGLGVFKILEEADYRLSFSDYLDWFTVPGSARNPTSIVELAEEDVVHQYNNLDDPSELRIATPPRDFGMASVSLVRSGAEVVVMCVFGQISAFQEEAAGIAGRPLTGAISGKDHIKPDPSLPKAPVLLDARQPMWRNVALMRLDVESMSRQVRYVLRDVGDRYDVLTDDPAALFGYSGEPLLPDSEARLARFSTALGGYESVFDAMQAFISLPAYCHEFEQKMTEVRVATKASEKLSEEVAQRALALVPKKHHYKSRRVSVIDAQLRSIAGTELVVQLPDLHVERTGYWKQLTPGQFGIDRKGQPIQGKTWVVQLHSWVEAPQAGPLVVRKGAPVAGGSRPRAGWIYVMRSAAHPEGVFKIGRTGRDADTRSRELSSASGMPDGLYVMHRWPAADCVAAEQRVHQELARFRTNPAREFFAVPYEHACAVIKQCIDSTDQSAAGEA